MINLQSKLLEFFIWNDWIEFFELFFKNYLKWQFHKMAAAFFIEQIEAKMVD